MHLVTDGPSICTHLPLQAEARLVSQRGSKLQEPTASELPIAGNPGGWDGVRNRFSGPRGGRLGARLERVGAIKPVYVGLDLRPFFILRCNTTDRPTSSDGRCKTGSKHEKIHASSIRCHVNGHKFCRAFDGWGISNGCTRRSAALWRLLSHCYVWARKSSLRFAARAIAEQPAKWCEIIKSN